MRSSSFWPPVGADESGQSLDALDVLEVLVEFDGLVALDVVDEPEVALDDSVLVELDAVLDDWLDEPRLSVL